MTAHLVAVLTLLFGVEPYVAAVLHVDPNTASPSQMSKYNDQQTTIEALCYAAFGCFGVDYIALFLGISMFFPPIMSLNIILHFAGTILTFLLINYNWSFDAWYAFFAVFNALPAVIELLMLLFVTRFSFLKY